MPWITSAARQLKGETGVEHCSGTTFSTETTMEHWCDAPFHGVNSRESLLQWDISRGEMARSTAPA